MYCILIRVCADWGGPRGLYSSSSFFLWHNRPSVFLSFLCYLSLSLSDRRQQHSSNMHTYDESTHVSSFFFLALSLVVSLLLFRISASTRLPSFPRINLGHQNHHPSNGIRKSSLAVPLLLLPLRERAVVVLLLPDEQGDQFSPILVLRLYVCVSLLSLLLRSTEQKEAEKALCTYYMIEREARSALRRVNEMMRQIR